MWKKFRLGPPGRGLAVFLLRNLLLYFLLVNAWLHFRGELGLPFLSVVFAIAVLLALWMNRIRLRFGPALLLALLGPFLIRLLFFAVFGLERAIAPGPQTDFLYFFFDKDFFPALLPFLLVWLVNYGALRIPWFTYAEAGVNALLLLAIFWSQARYRIDLYPHPSLLAAALFAFLFGEILVLMLARPAAEAFLEPSGFPGVPGIPAASLSGPPAGERRSSAGLFSDGTSWRNEARALLSFLWLVIPLLLVLLFFLLSRFNEGAVRLGGGLMKPTLFRFDFSQFIKLQSEIEMSEDLVLLFRKEGPAERLLLRRFILSGYDRRRGFYRIVNRDLEDLPTTVADRAEDFTDPGYLERRELRQEYYFVNFDPTSLMGINYPVKVIPLRNWDASSFLRIYRVHSRVTQVEPAGLGEVGQMLPGPASGTPAGPSTGSLPAARSMSLPQYRHYTDYGNNRQIKELAESITQGRGGYYAKVLAIRDYLRSDYFYSLNPGLAADGDQLAHFLFQSRKGYCSYFAFAMALMCRSLGIPARVAVGFYVDPEAEVLNFYEVRAYQAHAWVEVYFGDYGWIEFDPSSTEIAPGEEYTLRFVFDFQRLSSLIAEILQHQDQLQEETGEELTPQPRGFGWVDELARGLVFLARIWYLTLPLLYLLSISAIKGSPYLQFLLHRDPRWKIKSLYRFSLGRLYGLGLIRNPEESIREYAAGLEAKFSLRILEWTDRFLEATFADRFSGPDYVAALGVYRGFLVSFRNRWPLGQRLLAYLNPLNSLRRKI